MLFETTNIWLLNRIKRISACIGEYTKTLILFTSFVVICMIFSLYPQSAFDKRRMVIVSLTILAQIISLTNKEIVSIKWRLSTAMTIELFALLMIAVIPIHPIGQGYLAFAIDILILFPMLYIVLSNTMDLMKYYDLLTYAIIISGIVCFVFSVILARGDWVYNTEGRVAGFTKNPNYYGMVGLAMILAGGYNLARDHKNPIWKGMTAISTGIGISMIIVSVARTAFLSAFICFAAFMVFVIRKGTAHYKNTNDAPRQFKSWLCRTVLLLLVVALSCAASVMLQQRTFSENKKSGGIQFLSESLVIEIYADDGTDAASEKTTTIEDRFSTNTDIDTFSSGRISIWRRYSEHFNLYGNDYDRAKENGWFTGLSESRAHNNIVDYIFRFGISAGLVYTIFYIAVLAVITRKLFGKKQLTVCDLWVIMTTAAYAVYAIFEISTLPFTRYIPCLFFLSAAPLMGEPSESKESEF